VAVSTAPARRLPSAGVDQWRLCWRWPVLELSAVRRRRYPTAPAPGAFCGAAWRRWPVLLLPPVPSLRHPGPPTAAMDFQPGPGPKFRCATGPTQPHRVGWRLPAQRTGPQAATRAIRSRCSRLRGYPCRVMPPSWRACWCAVAWSMRLAGWACRALGLLMTHAPNRSVLAIERGMRDETWPARIRSVGGCAQSAASPPQLAAGT